MDPLIIKKIDDLLSSIEKGKRKLLRKSSWPDFTSWLNEPENSNHREKKIKKSTIDAVQFAYKKLSNTLKQNREPDYEQKSKWLNRLAVNLDKAVNFNIAVESFLSDAPLVYDPFHYRKFWYLYFFYLPDRKKDPSLGRVILETHSHRNVKLTNLQDPIHSDYEGQYSIVYNEVCFFDLETTKKDRKLHIKVYYSNPLEDEILLGSYITYESHMVTGGALALMPIKNKKDIVPLALSFKENREDFFNVPRPIRRFLCFKKHNFYKIPTKIFNLNDLEKFFEFHEESWTSRFIDPGPPKLFISSPGLSISNSRFKQNKEAIDRIIDNLNENFSDASGPTIDIQIHNNRDFGLAHERVFPRTLNDLKQTRFFVLIYTKTNIGSYSLVQLGWALAHCKCVMLFYEDGSISDHILTIPDGVLVQPFTDIEQEANTIYKNIELQILRNFRGRY